MAKKITKPSDAELRELFANYSLKEVAERCTVCVRTVSQWKNELGLCKKRPVRPTITELMELYKHHTYEEIAAMYGIPVKKAKSSG